MPCSMYRTVLCCTEDCYVLLPLAVHYVLISFFTRMYLSYRQYTLAVNITSILQNMLHVSVNEAQSIHTRITICTSAFGTCISELRFTTLYTVDVVSSRVYLASEIL